MIWTAVHGSVPSQSTVNTVFWPHEKCSLTGWRTNWKWKSSWRITVLTHWRRLNFKYIQCMQCSKNGTSAGNTSSLPKEIFFKYFEFYLSEIIWLLIQLNGFISRTLLFLLVSMMLAFLPAIQCLCKKNCWTWSMQHVGGNCVCVLQVNVAFDSCSVIHPL